MKIVVTGGAGFIGSHICITLAQKGYDVVALDSLERASATQRLNRGGIPLIHADLRKNDIPTADIYIHAAAYIDVAESWEKPFEYVVNNAAATARLAKEAGRRDAKVIYISSAAVYGEPLYLPIDEEHPTKPLSPYGLTKLWGEQISSMYVKRLAIIRPFNVYGPGQTGPYAGVITKFIERAKKGLPPVIFGDGTQTRDFIHVEDLANLVATVIERDAEGVYNGGTGHATSILELAQIVIKAAGLNTTPLYAPPRPGDIKHSVANIEKAKKLGWAPTRSLKTEIEKLLQNTPQP